MPRRREFKWTTLSDNMPGKKEKSAAQKEEEKEFYKPDIKGNNGVYKSIMRFLPPAQGEESPVVKVLSHFFQDVNGWFLVRTWDRI